MKRNEKKKYANKYKMKEFKQQQNCVSFYA